MDEMLGHCIICQQDNVPMSDERSWYRSALKFELRSVSLHPNLLYLKWKQRVFLFSYRTRCLLDAIKVCNEDADERNLPGATVSSY